MPTATYEPIATTTLGSAASSITFSSIPVTYSDLRLVLVATAASNVSCCLRINGLTSSIYTNNSIRVAGSGPTEASGSQTVDTTIYLGTNSSLNTTIPTMWTMDFIHYLGTNGHKMFAYTITADKDGATSGSMERGIGRCATTSAVSSISVYPNGANFNSGTTATLYGILRA